MSALSIGTVIDSRCEDHQPSTRDLRSAAERAVLTALAAAARRHDSNAVHSLSEALSALKESA